MATKTQKATAHVEIRSQHSAGSNSNMFGGPDTYVAVQIVPEGACPLKSLQSRAAELRGIEIKYFGEGYSEHRGPRSMLGQAIAAAEDFVQEFNAAN